jgi:two-component system response regulator HydG
MALVEQIAPSNLSVLIVGENGTGKEWTAQAIHRLSPRAYRKFIRVDCMNTPIEQALMSDAGQSNKRKTGPSFLMRLVNFP